jgi:hypothetical protein
VKLAFAVALAACGGSSRIPEHSPLPPEAASSVTLHHAPPKVGDKRAITLAFVSTIHMTYADGLKHDQRQTKDYVFNDTIEAIEGENMVVDVTVDSAVETMVIGGDRKPDRQPMSGTYRVGITPSKVYSMRDKVPTESFESERLEELYSSLATRPDKLVKLLDGKLLRVGQAVPLDAAEQSVLSLGEAGPGTTITRTLRKATSVVATIEFAIADHKPDPMGGDGKVETATTIVIQVDVTTNRLLELELTMHDTVIGSKKSELTDSHTKIGYAYE